MYNEQIRKYLEDKKNEMAMLQLTKLYISYLQDIKKFNAGNLDQEISNREMFLDLNIKTHERLLTYEKKK